MQVGNLQGAINGNEIVCFDYEVGDSYTKLMLHMDGTNGGTTFTDSATGKVPTVTATTTSTAQIKFGSASALFNGTSSILSYASSADWDFGSNDFTVEFWLYPTSNGSTECGIITTTTNAGRHGWLASYESGSIRFGKGSDYAWNTSANSAPLNTWTHFGASRNGNTLRLFINGAINQTIDVTGLTWNSEAAGMVIGRFYTDNGSNFFYYGYIDELRISKGIGRWTSAFSIPISAYICDPVSSISTGNILNGDVDGWYTIIYRTICSSAGVQYMQFNGDTGANYGMKGIQATGSSTPADSSATGAIGFYAGYGDDVGKTSFWVGKLYAKSGSVRLVDFVRVSSISGTTVTDMYPTGGVWNNTANNLVSIQVTAAGNYMGVGTRIIILKNNNLLTSGTPTGAITTPAIKGSWVRVGSQVLGSPASSVTFSGLDGNRDVLYYLSYSIKASGTIAGLVRFNSDSGANYGNQFLWATNNTISAYRETGATAQYITQNGILTGRYGQASMLMFAKSGFGRPMLISDSNNIFNATVTNINLVGGVWQNTADNLTSMVVSTANNFDTGSQFDLYALRPNG